MGTLDSSGISAIIDVQISDADRLRTKIGGTTSSRGFSKIFNYAAGTLTAIASVIPGVGWLAALGQVSVIGGNSMGTYTRGSRIGFENLLKPSTAFESAAEQMKMSISRLASENKVYAPSELPETVDKYRDGLQSLENFGRYDILAKAAITLSTAVAMVAVSGPVGLTLGVLAVNAGQIIYDVAAGRKLADLQKTSAEIKEGVKGIQEQGELNRPSMFKFG